MLMGTEDTRYSWLDELSDRRGVALERSTTLDFNVGVSNKKFRSDEAFLEAVLPRSLYLKICDIASNSVQGKKQVFSSILSGNYDSDWKNSFKDLFDREDIRRELFIRSRNLLNDVGKFMDYIPKLFEVLGDEGEYLKQCYYRCLARCGGDTDNVACVVLEIFIMFALYGPDGFRRAIPEVRSVDVYFNN